jgi:hypothetical protein
VGYVVTDIQPTPNPNAVKMVLDREIADRPTSFLQASAASGHPLASKIFAIPGVSSLLLLGDFVTVNKSPNARWADITTRVKRVLSDAS